MVSAHARPPLVGKRETLADLSRVRALFMGGQACVFYGAAEFSRDIDFAILADGGDSDGWVNHHPGMGMRWGRWRGGASP
jgi:hypothetical protein